MGETEPQQDASPELQGLTFKVGPCDLLWGMVAWLPSCLRVSGCHTYTIYLGNTVSAASDFRRSGALHTQVPHAMALVGRRDYCVSQCNRQHGLSNFRQHVQLSHVVLRGLGLLDPFRVQRRPRNPAVPAVKIRANHKVDGRPSSRQQVESIHLLFRQEKSGPIS